MSVVLPTPPSPPNTTFAINLDTSRHQFSFINTDKSNVNSLNINYSFRALPYGNEIKNRKNIEKRYSIRIFSQY